MLAGCLVYPPLQSALILAAVSSRGVGRFAFNAICMVKYIIPAFYISVNGDRDRSGQDSEQNDLRGRDQARRQFHVNETAAPDQAGQPEHCQR